MLQAILRHPIVAAVVAGLIFTFIPVGVHIFKGPEPEKTLAVWKQQSSGFLDDHGQPADPGTRVTVWYQFFERGLILYNVSNAWHIVFKFDKPPTWSRGDNPNSLISQGNVDRINYDLLNELMPEGASEDDKTQYRRLVSTRDIIGGIGTVYVRNGLLHVLREPLHHERQTTDALYVEGPPYDLFVNVVNRHTDDPDHLYIRAVYILFQDKSFRKNTVMLE